MSSTSQGNNSRRKNWGPSDLSITFSGFDRLMLGGIYFRGKDLLASQPTPEKSLIMLSEYLIGRDDLASLMVLGRVAYLDKRILIYLERLVDLLIKYGENTGAGFTLNLRRVYEEGGPREYEKAVALIKTYHLLLTAVRTSPNLSRMVNALITQMEYPHVERMIRESGGQRFGAPVLFGVEEKQSQSRRRRRRARSEEEAEAPAIEAVEAGE